MDLANLDLNSWAEDGFTFSPAHPVTGLPLETTITVLGKDSKAYRTMQSKALREAMIAKKEQSEVDADKVTLDTYAACVIGWTGVEENGQTVEFSHENAVRILDRYRWLLDQVGAQVEKRANFMKTQEKS